MSESGRRRIFLGLGVFVFSLLFALALGEIALRWIAPGDPWGSAFPLYPYRKRILQISSAGKIVTAVQTTNRWGFRGDDPPADWKNCQTIVAVGGSTTQCYYIDDRKTWPALVQNELARHAPCVWVGNAGLDGHSTRGHIVVMREIVSKIRPKMVLFLVGANDLGLSLSAEKEHLFDKPGNWLWTIYRHSRIAQMAYTWKLVHWDKVHRVTAVQRMYVSKPLKDAAPLPANPKELLPLLPEFESHVRELIAQTRSIGARPVFLTQPSLWEDTPRWRAVEGGFYWIQSTRARLSAAAYGQLLNLYNQSLLRVCREEGVDCFDLASAIPHEKIFFDDSVHLSEQGCALVGKKVATFLSERLDNFNSTARP